MSAIKGKKIRGESGLNDMMQVQEYFEQKQAANTMFYYTIDMVKMVKQETYYGQMVVVSEITNNMEIALASIQATKQTIMC